MRGGEIMTDSPAVTVCYNGACPVCRAEMEHYQRIADQHALPLGWNDINTAPELFRRHNIDFDTAMRRLHAVDAAGNLIRGIDVFIAIWRLLPRYRWAAAIVYRYSRRRLRRAQARAATSRGAG